MTDTVTKTMAMTTVNMRRSMRHDTHESLGPIEGQTRTRRKDNSRITKITATTDANRNNDIWTPIGLAIADFNQLRVKEMIDVPDHHNIITLDHETNLPSPHPHPSSATIVTN